MRFDSIDYKILDILQKDGRISMTKLGIEVSLSTPAVTERVKRMESYGVIEGYQAKINPAKLNKNIMAFIRMDIESAKFDRFLLHILDMPNIFECYRTVGKTCIIIKIMVENITELETLVDNLKKYGNTETSVILSREIKAISFQFK